MTEWYEYHGHVWLVLEDSAFLAGQRLETNKQSQIKTNEIRLFFQRMQCFVKGHSGNKKLHAYRRK